MGVVFTNWDIGVDKNKKIKKLLDYTSKPGDIADPWYTEDFEQTYEEIHSGCKELLKVIYEKYNYYL